MRTQESGVLGWQGSQHALQLWDIRRQQAHRLELCPTLGPGNPWAASQELFLLDSGREDPVCHECWQTRVQIQMEWVAEMSEVVKSVPQQQFSERISEQSVDVDFAELRKKFFTDREACLAAFHEQKAQQAASGIPSSDDIASLEREAEYDTVVAEGGVTRVAVAVSRSSETEVWCE